MKILPVIIFFIFYRNRIKLSQTISNISDLIHDIETFKVFFTRYTCHMLYETQKNLCI